MIGHRPSDDFAAVKVHHYCQVKIAFVGGDIGNIRDPGLVGCCERRLLFEPVGSNSQPMITVRGSRTERSFLQPANLVLTHQARNPMPAAGMALALKLLGHSGAAVTAPRLLVNLNNDRQQLLVVQLWFAWLALEPRIVTTARKLQDLTDLRHREFHR